MAETEAEAQDDVDDLPALTQNVRQLIQALKILKNTINSMSGRLEYTCRVLGNSMQLYLSIYLSNS